MAKIYDYKQGSCDICHSDRIYDPCLNKESAVDAALSNKWYEFTYYFSFLYKESHA